MWFSAALARSQAEFSLLLGVVLAPVEGSVDACVCLTALRDAFSLLLPYLTPIERDCAA